MAAQYPQHPLATTAGLSVPFDIQYPCFPKMLWQSLL
jgi:hypothetical protein